MPQEGFPIVERNVNLYRNRSLYRLQRVFVLARAVLELGLCDCTDVLLLCPCDYTLYPRRPVRLAAAQAAFAPFAIAGF